ncbi:MAG: CBS domain-containing protein [Gemmataceae bacterium]|nr:CBS domain-containing protein [Gemmataceae bacterium]
MLTTKNPLLSLKVADLMTGPVVTIPDQMSLQAAAHLLSQHRVSGAPVVDAAGRCVGVLSGTDFVQWAERGAQGARKDRPGQACVCSAWQIVAPESLPEDAVRRYMTADPVMVTPDVEIRGLARMMLDAHIHRAIVVDSESRPIGIVSSTDILAALAYAEQV